VSTGWPHCQDTARPGLGRAVLTTALAAYPKRTATLVATDSGVPLYTSLGFAPVAPITWYIRSR